MKRRLRPVLSALLGLTLLGGSVVAQEGSARESHALRPGDAILVEIWREEDLSGEFVVGVDGTVTLPLLGRMRLVEMPMEVIRDTLIERYQVHLRNPSINVVPIRRISVLGEVQKPGLYGVDPTLALAGVVALAGGATSDGTLDRIRIVRDGRVLRERVGAGETLTGADIRSGDQIVVERRSWMSRNAQYFVSAALSLATTITAALILSR